MIRIIFESYLLEFKIDFCG